MSTCRARCLILDFDGVIGRTQAMNSGIVAELHPDVPTETYLIDHHRGNVYEHPVVPFTQETAERYFALYNERLSVAHIAEAAPHLRALAERHGRLHIITSNCEHAIRSVLRQADLAPLFGLILGRACHTSKVHKFELLFEAEDCPAERSVFVTDTLGDLHEAAKVGVRTIAVTFGYHPYEVLAEGTPTRFAADWDEIARCAVQLLH